MGNVVIGNNIKKQKVRIDPNGNIIDKNTKAIIEPNIDENKQFEPQSVVQPTPEPTKNPMSDKINQMVEAKIKEKIDAIVAQRVEEALKNL